MGKSIENSEEFEQLYIRQETIFTRLSLMESKQVAQDQALGYLASNLRKVEIANWIISSLVVGLFAILAFNYFWGY